MRIEPTSVLGHSRSAPWQVLDGELVILLLEGDEMVGTNEVGATVWQLVDGQRSVSEIAAQLARTYGVEEEVALRDARAYLQELLKVGAVEEVRT